MGESRSGSLPSCDRCLHFVVREKGLTTCKPCRKLWQLQVSLRGVLAPKRDEQAVVYLQECFSLLEEWVAKVKELETEEASGDRRGTGARERSPLKRKEAKDSRPVPSKEKPAHSESSQSALAIQPKAPPFQPTPRSKGALPVEGRGTDKVTSQAVERPPEAVVESPPGELKRTPKAKEEKKEKKTRSSTSSSSRRRRKKEKKKREKEKKDKKRRRRSTSPGSSVSGSRVRAAKRKDLKRLPTPPRPRSPHTPPGPPPHPPPAPARDSSPPPIARGRGRGWIGPVPWSTHPRWYTGKNKGITRRAKQEKFNNRWWWWPFVVVQPRGLRSHGEGRQPSQKKS